MARIKGPKQTYQERIIRAANKKVGVSRRYVSKVKAPKRGK